MTIRKASLPLLFAAALTVVAGCTAGQPAVQPPAATSAAPSTPGASGGTNSGSSEITAQESRITISGFEYETAGPIPSGATVTVVNEDSAPHTVTAGAAGGFHVEVAGGETATFTAPGKPGEYEIVCTYHPQMSGTLVVE